MVRWVLGSLLALVLGACTSVQGSLNGKVALTISGLPEGVSPKVVVQGQGVEREVRASGVLELPEGDYVVRAEPVEGPQGEVYSSTVENARFRVEYGKTVEVRVLYTVQQETLPATLTVLVQGLPTGAEGGVTVTGPAGAVWEVKATTVLRGLKAGTYFVSARPVSAEGKVYTPRVDPASLTLSGGGSGSVLVQYLPPDTGYLAVEVVGLPSGVEGRVEVRSASARIATLSESQVLELEVGTYLVAARDVTADRVTYRASVSGSPAEVRKGATARVVVTYSRVYTTGVLTVTVSGLPSGVNADVRVSGPDGFTRSLTGSASLEVSPGTYTVEARDITTPGGVYRARVEGSPAQVQVGATSGVGVFYSLDPATAPGDLLVRVGGLPSGAMGSVRVRGPGGFDRTIGSTTLFSSLPAGYYTVEAGDVVYSGKTYRAVVTGSPVRVSGEGTATVQVDYSLYSAFLTVQVSGLPGPVANVVVTGPDGYSRTLNATAVLTVNPGAYAVAAYPVVVDGVTYNPQVLGSPVFLDPGGNGAVQVTYQAASP